MGGWFPIGDDKCITLGLLISVPFAWEVYALWEVYGLSVPMLQVLMGLDNKPCFPAIFKLPGGKFVGSLWFVLQTISFKPSCLPRGEVCGSLWFVHANANRLK